MEAATSLAPLFELLFDLDFLGLMLVGVVVGLFFGVMPGLGGKLGLVFLIPFVFGMDAMLGAVFLLAMHSVVHTSGAVPSILFGIPGTGPDAATIVDGYPMTQKGEAGRALGATFAASGLGGLIGALFLSALLPFAETLVLAFSPAEMFFLALLGITFIAALSGEDLLKGLIVGFFGLMLACVGADPTTGAERFTFGFLFLWDGIDAVTAVIAIFAIPEMIELACRGPQTQTQQEERAVAYRMRDIWVGCVDTARHWWLTLRASVIGTVVGLIPGLGGDVACWLSYGHAVQTSAHPERFGKGAVEGVIAPEAANNSKEGGALLPTLYFGVPGSSGMAILLGAFVTLGIEPGPQLAAEGGNLVAYLVWTLALANILAVVILLALAPWLSRISSIKPGPMVPVVLILSLLGAYLASAAWQSLVIVAILGALGYAFKKFHWSRPPFVVGLVLGPIAEDSLQKSLGLWGPEFVFRPLSIVLIALIVMTLSVYVLRRRRTAAAK